MALEQDWWTNHIQYRVHKLYIHGHLIYVEDYLNVIDRFFFNFEMILVSHAIIRNNRDIFHYTLYQISPDADILETVL